MESWNHDLHIDIVLCSLLLRNISSRVSNNRIEEAVRYFTGLDRYLGVRR